MLKTKYIVFDSKIDAEVPILFPSILQHSDIAETFTKKFPHYKPLSAGFVSFGDGGAVTCHGDSFSLNIVSRGAIDAMIIEIFMTKEF